MHQPGSANILRFEGSRRLGAYYTPDHVAELLARWVLPSRSGRVLDPSFGGCSFLRAALAHGERRGSVEVFGVDIDPDAGRYAELLHKLGVPRSHLLLDNFFAVEPTDLPGGTMDAVLGNPPYVRHHWHSDQDRNRAACAAAVGGLMVSPRADLWCYFVGHSLRFLRRGGRLCFLLPASLLYADYAEPVLALLSERFRTVRLIEIRERLFAEASEATVVVAAEGFGSDVPADLRHGEVFSPETLFDVLADPEWGSKVVLAERRAWGLGILTNHQRCAYEQAVGHTAVHVVGDVLRARIGVVTGANDFFVRTDAEARARPGKAVSWRRIVTRSASLRGTAFDARDASALAASDTPSALMAVDRSGRLPKWLHDEVDKAEAEDVHLRSHCRRREPWYVISDVAVSDVLLPYMGARPPRPVINSARVLSTNAVHRLWWESTDVVPADFIVGAWTSLYGLGAELQGRRYGGGVLKLEPSEAARIRVPVAEGASDVLAELDGLIRNSATDEAVALADDRVLVRGLGLSSEAVDELRTAEAILSGRRAGSRPGRR